MGLHTRGAAADRTDCKLHDAAGRLLLLLLLARGGARAPCSFFAENTMLPVSSPTIDSTTVSFARSTTVFASTTSCARERGERGSGIGANLPGRCGTAQARNVPQPLSMSLGTVGSPP
jgi:hypothetical protein